MLLSYIPFSVSPSSLLRNCSGCLNIILWPYCFSQACIFSSENAGNSAYPQSCEMSFLSGLGGFLNMLQESLPRDCSSYGLFLLLLFSWLSLLLSASCCCSCPHSCLSSL